MSDDRRGVGAETVILAGILGGIAGAALGLLLAPKAGSELRADLGVKAKEAGGKARELAELACEKAEEGLAAAKRWREEVMAKAEAEEAEEAAAAAADAGEPETVARAADSEPAPEGA